MRDYADYFMDKKPLEKRGVSIHHDIDWWMERFTGQMAKMLFIALLALLSLVIKTFIQVGKSHEHFPIEHVKISNNVLITTTKDIDTVLKNFIGKSFFSVDLDDISEQLSDLAWIESATVSRSWPNTLVVDIIEHQAAYRWGSNELLDEQGNRFNNINTQQFNQLPLLSGVAGQETKVIDAYQELVANLGMGIDRIPIKQFVLNQYLSWELHLESGLVIKFGRDDYAKRLARFTEAFQTNKLPDLEKLDVLDFRYNRGFAAKLKPEFAAKSQDGKLVKVAKQETTGI